MDAILPLVSKQRLPSPVKEAAPARSDSAVEEVAAAAPPARGAAYQALPVTTQTLITHNITPALPVLDVDELGKEVRRPAPPRCLHAVWARLGAISMCWHAQAAALQRPGPRNCPWRVPPPAAARRPRSAAVVRRRTLRPPRPACRCACSCCSSPQRCNKRGSGSDASSAAASIRQRRSPAGASPRFNRRSKRKHVT